MLNLEHFIHLPTPCDSFVWNGEEPDDPALQIQFIADPAWIGGNKRHKVLRIRTRGSYAFAQIGDRLLRLSSGEWQGMPAECFAELYAPGVTP